MKTTYIIKETNHVNSDREGDKIEATNLTKAKRIASRNKFFLGTVLKIEYENGVLVSYKEPGKKWVDM